MADGYVRAAPCGKPVEASPREMEECAANSTHAHSTRLPLRASASRRKVRAFIHVVAQHAEKLLTLGDCEHLQLDEYDPRR
jgi:hypothetical protein